MLRLYISLIAIALTIFPACANATMEDYPSVKLQGLDKSTARTTTFEAKVGSTITYGPLFIRIQSCRKAPPIEPPESAAFLQIWEVPPETGTSEWVFSGWMFASSPALSAMDHPVYDIWVLDCLGKEEPNEEAKQSESDADVESQDALAAPEGSESSTESGDAVPAEEQPAVEDSEADMSEEAPVSDEQQPVPAEVMPQEEAQPTTEQAPIDYDAPYSPSRGYPAESPQQGQ